MGPVRGPDESDVLSVQACATRRHQLKAAVHQAERLLTQLPGLPDPLLGPLCSGSSLECLRLFQAARAFPESMVTTLLKLGFHPLSVDMYEGLLTMPDFKEIGRGPMSHGWSVTGNQKIIDFGHEDSPFLRSPWPLHETG